MSNICKKALSLGKTAIFAGFFALTLSTSASAAGATIDTGVLTMFYVDAASGNVAVELDGGFPNATSSGQCTTSNGAAGNTAADPALKATLLSAKVSGQTIQIVIQGCDAGGAWWKIIAAYLR